MKKLAHEWINVPWNLARSLFWQVTEYSLHRLLKFCNCSCLHNFNVCQLIITAESIESFFIRVIFPKRRWPNCTDNKYIITEARAVQFANRKLERLVRKFIVRKTFTRNSIDYERQWTRFTRRINRKPGRKLIHCNPQHIVKA